MKLHELSWKVVLVAALCGVLGVAVTATFVRVTQRGVIAGSLGPTMTWLMAHGELARCETAPATWQLDAPNAGAIYAYDPLTLRSRNARAPSLDAATRSELQANPKHPVYVHLFGIGRGGLVLVRTAASGPCGLTVAFWRSTVTRFATFVSLALCGFVTGGLSASLSFWAIVRPLAQRLSKVSRAARLVGAPEGYSASELDRNDDLGNLSRELDRAHARIRADALELENRRRELQDHIADVAHDIRTPLASLQLALQEAGRHPDDREVLRGMLERALEDVVYVGGLIGNLRLASDMRHAWDPPPRPRQSLSDVLERSVLRLRFLAEQKGMSLELATPDEPVFVAADPIALEQALVNVLENAVVHGSQDGRVAALLERTPSGFRLTIVDDGPGVEPEDLPRLFERNFRANGADARHARGSGLGLAITHEVCRRLGYTLTFSREEPSGLRVTISGPSEPNG